MSPQSRITRSVLLGMGAILIACSDGGPAAADRDAQVAVNFLTPATVRSVVVEVSGPGVSPAVVLNIPVGTDSVARGTLTLSAGAGRRFVLSAFDSAGVATHRADTTIALVAGANTPLAVRLTPLASTLGITVTFGGARVTVLDTTTRGVLIGDSLRVEGSAVRADGTLVPQDSIVWATSNPGVATVRGGTRNGTAGGDGRDRRKLSRCDRSCISAEQAGVSRAIRLGRG